MVQGQEPSHFVRLFKGHMVVHAGGKVILTLTRTLTLTLTLTLT